MERFSQDTERSVINREFRMAIERELRMVEFYDEKMDKSFHLQLDAAVACGQGNCGKAKRKALVKASEDHIFDITCKVMHNQAAERLIEMWSDILNYQYEADLQWAVDEMVEAKVEERMLESIEI